MVAQSDGHQHNRLAGGEGKNTKSEDIRQNCADRIGRALKGRPEADRTSDILLERIFV